jgi:hypothetical protein
MTNTQDKVLKHLQAGSIIETSCDYNGAWISGETHNAYKISNHTLLALKHQGVIIWVSGEGYILSQKFKV